MRWVRQIGHHEQFCMFVLGQHIETVNFEIQRCSKFDLLWPLTLNRGSVEDVTVDNFACFTKVNMLTLLVLKFNIVWILTFFDLWPLNHGSDKEVTVDTFVPWTKANTVTLLFLQFEKVWNFDHIGLTNLTFWPL